MFVIIEWQVLFCFKDFSRNRQFSHHHPPPISKKKNNNSGMSNQFSSVNEGVIVA
jgi:hypothetical protein